MNELIDSEKINFLHYSYRARENKTYRNSEKKVGGRPISKDAALIRSIVDRTPTLSEETNALNKTSCSETC